MDGKYKSKIVVFIPSVLKKEADLIRASDKN